MADFRNAQTFPIDRNSVASINISNPSSTAFAYVWDYSITPATNANVGFLNQPNNGQAAGIIKGYETCGPINPLWGHGFTGVLFTVDPNCNFVVSNPNTASLSGYVRISN